MICQINGIPVMQQDMKLYEGHIAVLLDEVEEPFLTWKGEKIPLYMWQQILSFMQYSYEKYKTEAQIRLFYNENFNWWRVVVMPQEMDSGMTTTELKYHPLREEALEEVNALMGWKEHGSVHHHCSCSAFQSGTDLDNEKDRNGLHITIGSMLDDVYSIHARAVFRKVMYKIDPMQWIDVDKEEDLVTPSDAVFPELWKKFLIKTERPKVVTNLWPDYGERYKSVGVTGFRRKLDMADHTQDPEWWRKMRAEDDEEAEQFKETSEKIRDLHLSKFPGTTDVDEYAFYLTSLADIASAVQQLADETNIGDIITDLMALVDSDLLADEIEEYLWKLESMPTPAEPMEEEEYEHNNAEFV